MTDLLEDTSESNEEDMKGRFLTFQIDKDMFGIELRNVMEIVGIQPITEMPEMPFYVKGIINLRGKIIPVMDVRLRFKKPEKVYTDKTCIIVISFIGTSIGLIVDCVSEVIAIPEEDIMEKPEINTKNTRGYVKSIGKIGEKVVLLINCEKLLNEEEFDAVADQL
ncbi:MAG: chemotaxis protein CheW [Clostridiaceae bacterium]|nr:chemotaxis protein CheW [Clostridiaceae bacterium]